MIDGRFKKGQHWRPRRPYWDKAWLENEYLVKGRTQTEIAEQFGVTVNAIWWWFKKHSIRCYTMVEIRAKKHWGLSGEANGMYGKTGEDNPNWKGGVTPERQAFYSSQEWKEASRAIYERAGGKCERCDGSTDGRRNACYHHITSFRVKELRADLSNLVLLCGKCHKFVHSKKNVNSEFMQKEVQEC